MWAVFVLFAEAPKYHEVRTTESSTNTWDVLSHSVSIHDHEAHALPKQIKLKNTWRHCSHVILFKDGGYTRTCSGISRAAMIMAWSSLVFWRTMGGMGLQQAKMPCWSRGNASAIWSNMWFGRTYLKIEHGVDQSEHNTIILYGNVFSGLPCALIGNSSGVVAPSKKCFECVKLLRIKQLLAPNVQLPIIVIGKDGLLKTLKKNKYFFKFSF